MVDLKDIAKRYEQKKRSKAALAKVRASQVKRARIDMASKPKKKPHPSHMAVAKAAKNGVKRGVELAKYLKAEGIDDAVLENRMMIDAIYEEFAGDAGREFNPTGDFNNG